MEKEQLQQLADMISAKLLVVTKKALSLNDVMILTGLSKSHLYNLTRSNKIPHYKPSGKMVYFDRVEIENWMLSNRGASEEEIARASTSNTQDKSRREKIKELINKYCKPSTQVYRADSYQLKHLFEELAECYIVHDEFKEIMEECGFDDVQYNKCEHCYYFKLEMSDDKKIPKWLRGIGYQSFKYKD